MIENITSKYIHSDVCWFDNECYMLLRLFLVVSWILCSHSILMMDMESLWMLESPVMFTGIVLWYIVFGLIMASVKGKGQYNFLGRNPTSKLRDITCHMGSHSVTCHPTQVNMPHLTPAIQAGTWFTYPGGMEDWVYLFDLIAPRQGVELATFRSWVRRPTSAPPRQLSSPVECSDLLFCTSCTFRSCLLCFIN